MPKVALSGLRIRGAYLGKRKIRKNICVPIQRFWIDAIEIVFGIKEKISEHHVSELFDGACELRVAVIFFVQSIQIRDHARVCFPTLFLSLNYSFAQLAYGRSCFIRLAECDIECGYLRSILAERVEHVCKVRARKRPAAQNFLRPLIDVHDDDARIGMFITVRPQSESEIEGV